MNNTESVRFSIDITPPQINFTAPTDPSGITVSRNYTYINVSVSDTTNTSSFIDFNRSLVGYWSFDSYNSTHVFDNSTYGNNGTFNGTDFGTSNITAGKYGKALEFDGIDDSVEMGNSNNLAITGAITLEGWVKINPDLSTSQYLFGRGQAMGGNANYGYAVSWDSGSQHIFWDIYNSTTRSGLDGSDVTITDNDWHYIVCTWDGTTNPNSQKIYLDGTLGAQRTSLISEIGTPNYNFRIGRDGINPVGYFLNGSVDEVRVWNRALSEQEINASFNSGVWRLERNFTELAEGSYEYYAYAIDEAGNTNVTETRTLTIDATKPELTFELPTYNDGAAVPRNYTYINVTVTDASNTSSFIDFNRSLVGYWSFDSYNETHVFDNSTYGNNGTLEGNLSIDNITIGMYGSALRFYNETHDYIDCGNDAVFDITEYLTAEAWIKTSADGFVVWKGNGYREPWRLIVLSNNLRALGSNDGSAWDWDITGPNVIDNNWHHVALTFDKDVGMKLYSDGVLRGTDTTTGTLRSAPTLITAIGWGSPSYPDYYFNGTIDEVRIWNRTLSEQEINASFNSGAWRLERNFTDLADGDYEYYAYAIDTAGNSNSTETRTLTIDTTLPEITIISPSNTTYAKATDFNVSLNEDGDWCGFELDDRSNVTMTKYNATYFNYTNSSMEVGSHYVKFWCNDTAGQMAMSSTVYFTISGVEISVHEADNTTDKSWEISNLPLNFQYYCYAGMDSCDDSLAYDDDGYTTNFTVENKAYTIDILAYAADDYNSSTYLICSSTDANDGDDASCISAPATGVNGADNIQIYNGSAWFNLSSKLHDGTAYGLAIACDVPADANVTDMDFQVRAPLGVGGSYSATISIAAYSEIAGCSAGSYFTP